MPLLFLKKHTISVWNITQLIRGLLRILHLHLSPYSNVLGYLRFLLPHAVDAGRQLDCVERVGVVGWRVGDVGDHGGSAVDVAEGLVQ